MQRVQTFRRASWGMTKDEVRRTEDAKLVREKDDELGYVGSLLGRQSIIMYNFRDGVLVKGEEGIQISDDVPDSPVCTKLLALLERKYGKPEMPDNQVGKSVPLRTRSGYGFPADSGALSSLANWQALEVEITLLYYEDWVHNRVWLWVRYGQEKKMVKTRTFRRASWGMTKDEVRRTEDAELTGQGDDYLFYLGSLLGLDCKICYTFRDGVLVGGGAGFRDS
jgi:hypothetical protein